VVSQVSCNKEGARMKAAPLLILLLGLVGCTPAKDTAVARQVPPAGANAGHGVSSDAEAHCSRFGRVARLRTVSKSRVVYNCVPRT
jgi:hypothetical protein